MARFLDTHEIGSFAEADLLKLRKSPYNEFKVKHVNMLYNPEADLVYCLLEAPSKEAIEKHHAKLGSKCDSIIEIKSTT